MSLRLLRWTSSVFVLSAALVVSATIASAGLCGRPLSRGESPTAGDAVYVLRSIVGQTPCPACECDVSGDGKVVASDALSILKAAVGLGSPLLCSVCPKRNFVVFLTDDQRADTLWTMPTVQERLLANGRRFDKAYSTPAECAPFRASFLAGGYRVSNTGVKSGASLNGTMSHFRDADSLARRMQQDGYTTGFIGKYMHGYYPGFVPSGWTSFVANNDGGQLLNWLNLVRITYGSSTDKPTTGTIVPELVEYITSFHRDEAVKFIGDHGQEPFFLLLSLYSPHYPAIPDLGDETLFSDYFPANPSFAEQDLTDKPAWVRAVTKPIGTVPCTGLVRQVLGSLRSVDRLVGDVMDATEAAGVADQTYFMFLSDNGTGWGEHRINCDKGMPYEESIRVPLIVSGPDVKPGSDDRLVAADQDLPATILDLAGITPGGDGRSLLLPLRGANTERRGDVLIENYGYLEQSRLNGPLWAGLRIEDETGSWTYAEYGNGERELYDNAADPSQMQNLAADPAYKARRIEFSDRLAPRKGLALLTTAIAPAHLGVEYRQELDAWGGLKPLKWSVVVGKLPAGLTLGPASGAIRGTPTAVETQTFTVKVTDSGLATHSLKPEEFNRVYTLAVDSQGSGAGSR